MKQVEPQVFLLARPTLDAAGLAAYLQAVGAPGWTTDAPSAAEQLIEVAGRACYRSFEPGLNPNVTKIREGSQAYLENILTVKHGSVLEHANWTFAFFQVSRVLTHELVRHRAGTAISQESLRFVRLTNIPMWLPPEIRDNPEARAIFEEAVVNGEKAQQ
jgi:thymidylate synthase (FAD)